MNFYTILHTILSMKRTQIKSATLKSRRRFSSVVP
jgi:hypothetical protein